ncbi:EAL domain-containing protein [Rhizobium halophytocola]|uniref:Diguanylate cyclase (GGDEF)-like protein/PAS domain S-box-containing protein n=1 Tax=Rhizobium halophytocola TaxID=735519 RepID=A0ABS4E3U7_9HYPH|nr:EAL domain-containing protein [Rhizobium halophytocola]MBP1852609.1 diguanylate cyclase (GGDEF)-like protein/PAS domain S-box-containing protein [Rhizobium halophytocola]
MTHSVESRFLAIVGGAVLALVVPLFALFLFLSTERATRELEDHVGVLLNANAQALAKPLWDFDEESVLRITAAILSDQAVNHVRVSDASGALSVSMPENATPPASFISRKVPIVYKALEGPKTVGELTIYYEGLDVLASLNEAEGSFIAIFIIAVVLVIGAAIAGNRLMIIKPLLKLTAAIEATRKLGARHHVDWQSRDEMGRLAKSFNAMQFKLDQEEQELKLAHRRATDIYNMTPALLFSIDEDDRITGVSDYWLLATGYKRTDILGTRFSNRVPESDRQGYLERKRERDLEGGRSAWECTTKFTCADGRTIDVLIVESVKKAVDDAQGLSLSVMTDVTALKQSEARNHHQAITDHLTGLLNRQGFEHALDQKISEADALGTELGCLFIDLDRFKWINDNLGHQAGDSVLRRIADEVRPLLPLGSVAARLGGDEFAILFLDGEAEARALQLSAEICAIFDEAFVLDGSSARLSASIGIALYPTHAENATELLQHADLAMYSKKHGGKNGAKVYHPLLQDSTRQRAEIERSIELALANDWFHAFLQPIVDLTDGTVIGYESLMRLAHPEKGLLPPFQIITVAEETGDIVQIGDKILEKALANLRRLTDETGDETTYLAVNYSPLQFEPGLPPRLASLFDIYGIRPQRMVIEITEAMLLHDNPQVHAVLEQLKDLGCRIALDDFGTGYSSLSYLNRFPVDIIKIDQSFIRSLTEGETGKRKRSRLLAEGITEIAHKMGCSVVAEGIETGAQWEIVRDFGCDYGQGYLFARPQRVDDLIEQHLWLQEKTTTVA